MRVYNTLTRQKEELVPLQPNKIKMYVCGPTVYNYIHIGNARPIVVFDTLRRYLTYLGYDVIFAQNFTDIDDKIIHKANTEGIDYTAVTERFIREYNTDVEGLGVCKPNIIPRATETMKEIIEMIGDIISAGYGYQLGGDVYFRARHFKEYGKLSKQDLDELNAGARIAVTEQKEDPLDFALWKAAKPGEPAWESPWGNGRPGWHIECSAMVKKHLGDRIDIHGGGQDLIFPHHENEIAQSESCETHGENYANYWMHNGYINVNNQKMAKSKGNFFTVRDVAEEYGYEPIKMMLIAAHYRSPINYTLDVIEQSKNALERLYTSRANLDFAMRNADNANNTQSPAFLEMLDKKEQAFRAAMDDDLNTADALSVLFELVRELNIYMEQPRPSIDLQAAAKLFDKLADVLGIMYNRPEDLADEEILKQIALREEARKAKNYALADQIRADLKAKGIELEDTPQGVKYHIVK